MPRPWITFLSWVAIHTVWILSLRINSQKVCGACMRYCLRNHSSLNKLLIKLLLDRLQSQGALGNSAPPLKCSNTCIYLKINAWFFLMTLQLLNCLLQEDKYFGFLQTGKLLPSCPPTLNFQISFGFNREILLWTHDQTAYRKIMKYQL